MQQTAGSDFVRELFAQREWLGRLALSLVNDEALAQDLVQETWLSALRTQPAADAGLRGWLATVLRNRARTQARNERERKRREKWAAREELLPSAGDVLERAAIQQEVAGVVMQLAEPYRETILLRFFDELPPRTIARRMKVPVSTVKTRISRGLERLRELLDRNYGGQRDVWMASIVVLCEVPRRAWLWKASAAAGLLALGGGGAWVALQPEDAPGAEEREDLAAAEVVTRVEVPVEPFAVVEAPLDAEPQAQPEPAAVEAETEPPPDSPDVWETRERGKVAKLHDDAPPGTLLVKGGTAIIGVDWEEAREVALAEPSFGSPENLEALMELSSPRHERDVSSFALMTTEVTNQQYMEYVNAAEVMPPLEWVLSVPGDLCDAAVDRIVARDKMLVPREPGLESARPADLLEWLHSNPALGDRIRQAWAHSWEVPDLNSRGLDIPEGWEQLPVVDVTHREAEGYAAWAGMRLPSEFEHEWAVRGKKGLSYPWGNEWQENRVMTRDTLGAALQAVGVNRGGRTKLGIEGLLGNVREWTGSPLEPYPGNEQADPSGEYARVLFSKSKVERVVVRGASFRSNAFWAHGAVRFWSEPGDRSRDIGFRCAASPRAGVDRARTLARNRLVMGETRGRLWRTEPGLAGLRDSTGGRSTQAAESLAYDPQRTVAIDRWWVKKAKPRSKAREYALITDYECLLLLPVERLADGPDRSEPSAVAALLYSTFPLAEPELPAGENLIRLLGLDGNDPTLEVVTPAGGSRPASRATTVPGSRAFLSGAPGPQQVRLLPDNGELLREVEFKLGIPGRDNGWWNIEFTAGVERKYVKGRWRDS